MYDFKDISTNGLSNVLHNNGLITAKPSVLDRETMISVANSALESGELDEIELILEESGE